MFSLKDDFLLRMERAGLCMMRPLREQMSESTPFLLLNRTYVDPDEEILFIQPRSQVHMKSDGISNIKKHAYIVGVKPQKLFTHLMVGVVV
jgi:hypothetical protein